MGIAVRPASTLHRLRKAGLDCVEHWLPSGSRVLEVGGGDGFQAHLLADRGFRVTSIDTEPRPPSPDGSHPVERYDGRRFPYPDASFDAAFSSNVLEHVVRLSDLLHELKRVVRREGVGVHLIPTPSWRFWTSATRLSGLLYSLARPRSDSAAIGERIDNVLRRNKPIELASKLLGFAPHGAFPNAVSELYYFSKSYWRRQFDNSGYDVIHAGGNFLFYTGNALFPGLTMQARQRLSRALGPSCHVFVVRQST